jgi:DNA-binding transcriptional LysR family regulator
LDRKQVLCAANPTIHDLIKMTISGPLLDTKLLKILDEILSQRNVSKAARHLGMSQPAVSAALRKIREIVKDPLVVTDGKGLVLTTRAEQMHPLVKQALSNIEAVMSLGVPFDPASAEDVFKIASSDNVVQHVFTELIAEVRRTAPKVTLEFSAFGANFDPFVALKDGQIDVVIGNFAELPENLHYSRLYQDKMVCLMSKKHRYASGITKQQYLDSEHIGPTLHSVGKRGVVDQYLSRHRLTRNIKICVPFFNLTPYALVKTDLIATMNESMAMHYAQMLDLALVDAPLPFPQVSYVQLWHDRTQSSPALMWLRSKIKQAATRGRADGG